MNLTHEPKWLAFKENAYKFLKINSMGYNDFALNKISGFLTTNVWHALYFVRNGSGTLTVRNQTYTLTPGCFYFITPNESVLYHSDETDPIQYYWISVYPEFAEEIERIMGFTEDKPVRPANKPDKIIKIFERLMAIKTATSEAYFETLSAIMKILSLEFSNVEYVENTSVHKAFAENVKKQIDLNYTNPNFHIEAVAQMLYVSHAHMSRIFKEVMGITPVRYLIEVRLNYAAKLLKEPGTKVKDLCEQCGFGDEAHFMKSFKKKFGITVNQYRKES